MTDDQLGLFGTGEHPPVSGDRPDPRRRSATRAADRGGDRRPGDHRDGTERAGDERAGDQSVDRVGADHATADQHGADQHGADQHGADQHGADQHTGGLDLDALRAALHSTAHKPQQASSAKADRLAAREQQASARASARRRTRRRRRSVIFALLVLVLISSAVVGGFLWWKGSGATEDVVRDYAGTGDTEVVVRIQSGDGLPTIARKLADASVVASAQAFIDGAANDADVAALHPGFYRVRQHSSAAAAADQIVDGHNHVGQLRLIPGRQLADISTKGASGGSTVAGYLSDIAKASCVPLNGITKCATVDELEQVARSSSANQLPLPEWALSEVAKAPDLDKRLEGMILPGDYDVPPGADATTLLTSVIADSTSKWNSSDIIAGAAAQHVTPYQAVIIASLVEREGITQDMPQVAEVVYNRLAKHMKLQFDSTVNYALNRAQIATSGLDRDNPSPYNTYRHTGLPPTPISSPGAVALDSTFDPAPGTWLYFVKVDKKTGQSCFSVTRAEHDACVAKARANGVFDG